MNNIDRNCSDINIIMVGRKHENEMLYEAPLIQLSNILGLASNEHLNFLRGFFSTIYNVLK